MFVSDHSKMKKASEQKSQYRNKKSNDIPRESKSVTVETPISAQLVQPKETLEEMVNGPINDETSEEKGITGKLGSLLWLMNQRSLLSGTPTWK